LRAVSTSLPRPPLWLVAAGFVGWAVFTLGGAQIDQESTSDRFVHDGLQTIATVFLALGVGGGLLELWQRREWQRRTQWIPFNLLNQAMRQVAVLVSKSVELVDDDSVASFSGVFILPWSAVGDRALQVQGRAVASTLPVLLGDRMTVDEPSTYQSQVIERLQAVGSELEDHADRLWSLASELGVYVDDVLGPELLTRVGGLHDAVRDLVDPFPGDRVTDPQLATLTGFNVSKVLECSGMVAQWLGRAYVSAQKRVMNDSLRERLQAEKDRRAEADKATSELLDSYEELQRHRQAMDEAGQGFDDAGAALLHAIQEALDSPDTDESTLRTIAEALEEARRMTADLAEALKDDSPEEPPSA
jgi:hypothetical protein